MVLQAHPFRRIVARFFPRKYLNPPQESNEWELLDLNQKKDLASEYLAKGELSLLQGNLNALSLFASASSLDPENPVVWYRQGLSFFEYGSEEGREKALLLASKYFKIATQYNPSYFDAWVAWGNTLLQLGRFHLEHHFLIEAKEKYQKALDLSSGQSTDILAELYWDYGIAWMEISTHSGEALDLRLAIEAFQTSLEHQKRPSPEFYNDMGSAYLDLGLLINDTRLYYQAIEHFQKALTDQEEYFDGWFSLAECYSQLYINTMDEKFVQKASDSFARAAKLSPKDPEVWLSWAQILGESGRLNDDPKQLRLSIEKCARASTLDNQNPAITAQWVESLSLLGAITGRLDMIIEAENKILKATDLYPDDPDLWHAYGISCMAFGRYYEDAEYYEIAIEKLQVGLSIDRTSGELWHMLGLVHKHYADLTQHEDLLERANRFFARAIDLKPSCPSILFDAASSFLRLSEMTDDAASLEKAIEIFEPLLQNHKEAVLHHPEWLYEYATALEWLGDFTSEESYYTRAIELFTHVLLIDPDFGEVHSHIALCYVELGNLSDEPEFYRRAIHFFRISLRNDEENDQTWLDCGIALIHLAHHTIDVDLMNHLYWDAEQKIHRAGQLGNSNAYYHLACLYSILGRVEEAFEFIQKALSARALPTIDEMLDDEWLENLCSTELFQRFLNALEMKLRSREE